MADTGHKILFSQTEKLFQSTVWSEWVIRKALEIRLDVGVLNREDGLQLSSELLPALELIGQVSCNESSVTV